MSRLLILIAVLGLASGAYGVLVEKGGTALLSDDFEGVAAGNAPDNGAAPGTWAQQVYGDSWVKVVNDAAPGAYQGSQYVSLNRGKEPPSSEAFLHGQFDAQVTGILKASFMMYIPSAGQGFLPAAVNLAGGTEGDAFATRVVWLAAWADGNNVKEYRPDPLNWSNTGVTWAYDKWQKWEIELDMGASDLDFTDSYTIAVDGVKSASIPVSQERSVSYLNMRCGTGDGSSFYVDAVPEPASMALLALGGLGLLRRRR